MPENKLIAFNEKNIRRQWHNDEWWFSIVDVIEALTDSNNPRRYWSDLKHKLLNKEGFSQLYEKIVQLKLTGSDGKNYATDTANTETLLRIIQSIPSPKAEPFKRWLAKIGYERIKEIEDPEIASKRIRDLYKAKGYPDEWIEKRMRGIAIHDQLTSEWSQRGVKEGKDYAILTAEISKAAFGMTPNEYKQYKGLKQENLRDHMTDLELIFSMLSEASTMEIAKNQNAQGFDQNRQAAKTGGGIAGEAREKLERASRKKITSHQNFLQLENNIRRLKKSKQESEN